MNFSQQDFTLIALTAWRENRGGGSQGMQSVINVILNRTALHKVSPYIICTQHAQFSSISEPGPESYLWPSETDSQWLEAIDLTLEANKGTLEDITSGATSYYAPAGMPGGIPPIWASKMTFVVEIGNQRFYK